LPPAPVAAANGNGSHAPPPADGTLDLATVGRAWEQVVATLKNQQLGRNLSAQMSGMQMAWPVSVRGNVLVIGFQHELHRKKLDEPRYRALAEDIFGQVLGQRVLIQCELRPADTRPDPASFAAPAAPLAPGSRASKARAIFEEDETERTSDE
jgi:hypothetical protein